MRKNDQELSVIQRTHDLIVWAVPMVNKLPRDFRQSLGERLVDTLYGLLELLIESKYSHSKKELLSSANIRLDFVRAYMRFLLDFKLIDGRRYYHASELVHAVGVEIGGWLKQQRNEETQPIVGEGDRS